MLDREGFRPNVGIILLNHRNQVFWGKRIRTHSWQFPQGGINHGETPEQAMFRELHEEVGLMPIMCASSHARATGCATRCRRTSSGATPAATTAARSRSGSCCSSTGRDSDMNLRATDHPEFDAWRWNEYWIPLDVVIEFKRDVYQMALTELARFLPAAPSTTATCAPACGRITGKTCRIGSAARTRAARGRPPPGAGARAGGEHAGDAANAGARQRLARLAPEPGSRQHEVVAVDQLGLADVAEQRSISRDGLRTIRRASALL